MATSKCAAGHIDKRTGRVQERCPEPVAWEITRGLSGMKQLLCEGHAKGVSGRRVRIAWT